MPNIERNDLIEQLFPARATDPDPEVEEVFHEDRRKFLAAAHTFARKYDESIRVREEQIAAVRKEHEERPHLADETRRLTTFLPPLPSSASPS